MVDLPAEADIVEIINLFLLSLFPLAYTDYKKQILPHDYMAVSFLIAICIINHIEYNFSYYNIAVTLILIFMLVLLPFTGLWGMGDSKLCLILMIVFSTYDFIYILLTASVLALIFNLKNISSNKLKISFGTYLVLGTFGIYFWNKIAMNYLYLVL